MDPIAWVAAALVLALVGIALPMLARRSRPRGFADRFDLDELARRLGVDAEVLRNFQPRYSTRNIAKRSAASYREAESRRLSVPDAETKALQRKIVRKVLRKLRVHPAASAWELEASPARNAALHQGRAVVIKLDIIDFFGTTRTETVHAYFKRLGWTDEASTLLTKLTTHEESLPQGAPTSPFLANRLAYPIDRALHAFVAVRFGRYSRYGDDITISFPKDYPTRIRGTIQEVQRVLRRYGYRMHRRRKLLILRQHQRQLVTGCVVNSGARLPREKRRWLRAVEHRMRTTGAATLTEEQLRGYRAWEASIEAAREQKTKDDSE